MLRIHSLQAQCRHPSLSRWSSLRRQPDAKKKNDIVGQAFRKKFTINSVSAVPLKFLTKSCPLELKPFYMLPCARPWQVCTFLTHLLIIHHKMTEYRRWAASTFLQFCFGHLSANPTFPWVLQCRRSAYAHSTQWVWMVLGNPRLRQDKGQDVANF